MKKVWSDQQLKEAVLASLAVRHYNKSAVYYEEGYPEKAIPYDILSGPRNDASSEQARQTNAYGFTTIRNDISEV
jgi:hypothetical protein